MSSQSEDGDNYRKALDEAIKAQGLVPPNKKLDRLRSVYHEHIWVIGQLAWKLKSLGVGDGLLSTLMNAHFNPEELGRKLTKAEKKLLKAQEVDETIYHIQEALRALEAIAPEGPVKESTLAKDKAQFEQRIREDDERKDFVQKWRERSKPEREL